MDTLAGIPDFVDHVYVVDDASRDSTVERAEGVADPRVEVIRHDANKGVGAAIVTGYRRALEKEIDVTCVIAADNQMDPSELRALVAEHGDRTDAELLDLRDDLLGGRTHVVDHDVGACSGQGQRLGATEAGPGAGDDGGAALEGGGAHQGFSLSTCS